MPIRFTPNFMPDFAPSARVARMFRFALLLAALAVLPSSALAAAQPVPYGKGALLMPAPSGFTDVTATAGPLWEDMAASVDGQPLRLYLPNLLAQRLAEGRADDVTRSVLLYGVADSARYSTDKKQAEYMMKTLEAAFTGYKKPPESIRADREALQTFYREAMRGGTPVLAESAAQSDNALSFVALLSYSLEPDAVLCTALCVSLTVVGDAPVFIAASSVVTDDDPAGHLAWTRASAESFAEMLLSANKNPVPAGSPAAGH